MSLTEPGWTMLIKRRPPRQRLQRRHQPCDRPLPRREPCALVDEQSVDDRDARLAGGDIRLGLLDARGDRRFLRPRLASLILLARRLLFEPRRSRGGGGGLLLGLDQALLLLGGGRSGRRGTRHRCRPG